MQAKPCAIGPIVAYDGAGSQDVWAFAKGDSMIGRSGRCYLAGVPVGLGSLFAAVNPAVASALTYAVGPIS